MSYPARGTWIEMLKGDTMEYMHEVVPRTGYVDRNVLFGGYGYGGFGSYPARGTWIEIYGF